MNVTDLTNAIISGINDGGEAFLEGTLAAVLPIVWLAILGLHLGRPYILDMIDRFTLRLGADLLWLVYVALRDLMIVSGVVMSFMFFFPDVVTGTNLPITGGFAAATLFAVLLIKLMGDPDHDPRLFSITTCAVCVWGAGGECRHRAACGYRQLDGVSLESYLGARFRLRLDRLAGGHGRHRRDLRHPHRWPA
jgi:hypothetical protein